MIISNVSLLSYVTKEQCFFYSCMLYEGCISEIRAKMEIAGVAFFEMKSVLTDGKMIAV